MTLVKTGRLIVPANPATPEQIMLNVRRWQEEQKRKARKVAFKKAVTARVTEGHSTIGEVVVAHLLKGLPEG